jgi:hypothetical protein
MPPKQRGRPAKGQTSIQGPNSGTKVTIPVKQSQPEIIQAFVKYHPNLTIAEDSISIFKEVLPMKLRGQSLRLDNGRDLLSWEANKENASIGLLTVAEGQTVKKVMAYQKVMPLLDPYHWMRFKERPSEPFIWAYQKFDIVAPENQGYVDCVASYLASRLRNSLQSPHFCDFYGAFRAVTDIFHYNLEEDLEDFRFTKWFWNGYEAGDFNLRVTEKKSGRRLTKDEILKEFKPDEEFLHDDDDDDTEKETNSTRSGDDETNSEISAQSLKLADSAQLTEIPVYNEITDVDSIPDESDTIQVYKRGRNVTPKTIDSITTASNDNDFTDEYIVHAELYKMPVAIQYLEKCEGTMDELLEIKQLSPILTSDQEAIWTAWLFQICVACTQLQNILNLTHNDLHTCNILWKNTEIEYLYYTQSNGNVFKVPTYGKIFSIIDYGRSIFLVNNFMIISSDYNDGHDACGMYNFGPIEDPNLPRVRPNKSFDLCRLACNLLRGLYPRNPPEKPKGSILTHEGDWKVRETVSPLFNLLWTWLRTNKKHTVLETEHGQEKYPGFNLYATIAKEVSEAVPENQLSKPIFQTFLLKTKIQGVDWISIP